MRSQHYTDKVQSAADPRAAGKPTLRGTSTRARFASFAREQDGSMVMFALILFILMLAIGGMAVDLQRFETKRVKLQATLDASTLAATSLKQSVEAEAVVRDYMTKAGYDGSLVGVNIEESRVGADDTNEGTLVSRRVTANYDLAMNTFFMHMLGYDTLGTPSGGQAFEQVQNVEISLVVDISGSMGGSKIAALKSSAKQFVNAVVDEDAEEGITTVSIIPYNHAVVMPDSLYTRLNTNSVMIETNPAPYTGALTQYPRTHAGSRCARFYNADMRTNNLAADYADLRRITPTQALDMMAYYDPDSKSAGGGDAYSRPDDDWNRRCDPTRGAILPFETSIEELEDHIDSLYADGWTAIDNGLKWASALLDPAMRPVISNMIDAGILEEKVRDRPGDYDPVTTLKVVVLMTDGANTVQYDLKNAYKKGPSRIWESPSEGFFVLMPNNGNNSRWLKVNDLDDNDDGELKATNQLPNDARQLEYSELYNRFSERAVADFFYDQDVGDTTAYNAHRNAETTVVNGGQADDRLLGTGGSDKGLCDAVKYNDEVLIYSIAFSAGSHAESIMRSCASGPSYFYNANDGAQLAEAFANIAGSITKLRLTQ